MWGSFTNQGSAQVDLLKDLLMTISLLVLCSSSAWSCRDEACKTGVYLLPWPLDEKVAYSPSGTQRQRSSPSLPETSKADSIVVMKFSLWCCRWQQVAVLCERTSCRDSSMRKWKNCTFLRDAHCADFSIWLIVIAFLHEQGADPA